MVIANVIVPSRQPASLRALLVRPLGSRQRGKVGAQKGVFGAVETDVVHVGGFVAAPADRKLAIEIARMRNGRHVECVMIPAQVQPLRRPRLDR